MKTHENTKFDQWVRFTGYVRVIFCLKKHTHHTYDAWDAHPTFLRPWNFDA